MSFGWAEPLPVLHSWFPTLPPRICQSRFSFFPIEHSPPVVVLNFFFSAIFSILVAAPPPSLLFSVFEKYDHRYLWAPPNPNDVRVWKWSFFFNPLTPVPPILCKLQQGLSNTRSLLLSSVECSSIFLFFSRNALCRSSKPFLLEKFFNPVCFPFFDGRFISRL